METKTWSSLEKFLSQNRIEFIHVETEEEFNFESEKILQDNKRITNLLKGGVKEQNRCKRWLPVRRRVCMPQTGGGYTCVTHTTYICVEKY